MNEYYDYELMEWNNGMRLRRPNNKSRRDLHVRAVEWGEAGERYWVKLALYLRLGSGNKTERRLDEPCANTQWTRLHPDGFIGSLTRPHILASSGLHRDKPDNCAASLCNRHRSQSKKLINRPICAASRSARIIMRMLVCWRGEGRLGRWWHIFLCKYPALAMMTHETN